MGRAYSQPKAEYREPRWAITRVNDPDDEFASTSVLCRVYDPASGTYLLDEFEWQPTGSSYDGNAVEFERVQQADQAIGLMRFGRDSVSVSYEL